MSKDYYDILGINRNASQDDVKKAYRKLAMKHHPDRNKDNPNAEVEFKKINEANSVLSDASKRQQYDQMGHQNFTNMGQNGGHSGHAQHGDFSDIFGAFSDIFGGSSRQAKNNGNDLLYVIELTFEESLLGLKKEIQYQRQNRCAPCHGNGAEPGHTPKPCQSCHGSGHINISQGFIAIKHPCPTCNGQGKIISVYCKKCRGKGLVKENRKVQIDIPKGMDQGDRIRIRGEGEAGPQGGSHGDLYVEIHIKPHEVFKRQGLDLYTESPISIVTAALGGEIKVAGTSGSLYSLTIPAGTQSHTVFRMRQKGITNSKGQTGDLLIKAIVETPVKLSHEQKTLLKQFESSSFVSNGPKQNAFWSHIEAFVKRMKN